MDKPSTPSRRTYGDGPPSYMNTPTDDDGMSSVLSQSNDDTFRPYVSPTVMPVVDGYPPSPKRKPVPSPYIKHVNWGQEPAPRRTVVHPVPSDSFVAAAESALYPDKIYPDRIVGQADTIRATVTLSRNSQTDRSPVFSAPYHRPAASTIFTHSRPGSSLGHTPTIPPPIANVPASRRRSPERSSPIRPSTPSRVSTDWQRPTPSVASYEPADLNGSPRPGTPSSLYGGSPRRPLPPAPLFAATATRTHCDDAAIPIDLEEDDDVFVGGREIMPDNDPRASLKSSNSYMSDSTFTDEYDPDSKIDHYAPAPEGKQTRRGALREAKMTKKEVRLINGELILECKIPTILHSFLPRRDEREFTHMRYTAVTCDPDEFVSNGYKLRQNIGSTMRETELFICVTMYNENEIDFTRTMHGIMRNVAHFCSRTKSRTWGKDGWQKIVVCVIADGRQKVHPRTLNALAAMGVYQDGIAKNVVNQKEVSAHVYEYTTQVSLDEGLKFKGAEKGIVPCQMIFCLKEKNKKKLNSHRWFFNAFGRALQPNVCILLDVGTKPDSKALYHLWKAFDQDSNVAGAAGEIKAMKGKGWLGLLNPLVASQNFEYKMSNILDKPLESVFGYITVLPGALSAYRYYALQNDPSGHGPLSQYFKGETLHGADADVFTANMYLAEDRILCWELVAKRGEQWVLKFVKSAVGETDVPGKLFRLLSFSMLTYLRRCPRIYIATSTLAQRCLLRSCIFACPLQADLAHRSLACPESPAAHRIRLPVHLVTLHLLLPGQLLPHLLLRGRQSLRPDYRPIRPRYRTLHICCDAICMRYVDLSTIHPQHGQPTTGRKEDVHGHVDQLRRHNGVHYLRSTIHRYLSAHNAQGGVRQVRIFGIPTGQQHLYESHCLYDINDRPLLLDVIPIP